MKNGKQKTEIDVRNYLLGKLPESERESLEKRVLTEAEINDEILAAEDELIDQYLAGKLDTQELPQFESHFLATEARQRKLHFGQTLRRYLASQSQVPSAGGFERPRTLFSWLGRHPAFAACLVLAVCLGVSGVLWISKNRRTRPAVSPASVAITLVPGSTRDDNGETQRIKRPSSGHSVEIQLELGSSEYSDYQVELFREHESVNTYKNLHPQTRNGHVTLSVVVGGNELTPGDYTFKVSGTSASGELEFKDQYQLRVTPSN
jgi:hypothetical protein